jgi:hypothetical protein
MVPSRRLPRLLRLRTRRREHEAAVLRGHAARVAALDRELAATRAAESTARIVPGTNDTTAALLAGAWANADALARRETALHDDRARALAALDGARDRLRDRWRDERQVGALVARIEARAAARTTRAADRRQDELALRSHGRNR